MEITRPTFLEIDLNNFKYNIEQIRKMIGAQTDIMPVLKANAYGTYINKNLEILKEFNIVAVATVDEAVQMRRLGYEKEIFVLNQPFETEIEKIIEYNITIGISSIGFLQKLKETGKQLKVHVEIGTGMGRTGINPYRVEEYLSLFSENVKIEGIYTHFSSAECDDEYTKKQLKSFNIAVEKAKEILGKIKYIHAAASNAILNYPDSHFNLVRPGIIMYGYESAEENFDKIKVKPVAKLKSTVTFLKDVKEGTSIGYDRSYIAPKAIKVATIPLGYADGFRRTFSNGWEVMINGKKAPIIGKICMDSFMVDVTEIKDIEVGNTVTIWDNENIKLEELAAKCDTINYEILCTIGERVPRKFVHGGRPFLDEIIGKF